MASTGIDHRRFSEKEHISSTTQFSETPLAKGVADDPTLHNTYTPRASSSPSDSESQLKPIYDSTHRKLKPRHIQLIGIGGTIGTALYVQIGHGLINGGPGSLFLAFTIW